MVVQDDVRIGWAEPGDGRGIADLIVECFKPEQRELFIYGCEGAAAFAEDCIGRQRGGGDSLFMVAKTHRMVGFIETRRMVGSVCLSYGAISSEARGKGVYRRLMVASLEAARDEGAGLAVHDVFVGNTIRELHERVGYRVLHRVIWRASPIVESGGGAAVISGLPQADAVHARFGFSQIFVTTSGGRHDVGRLGRRWFRSTSPDLLSDRDALAALHRLDPSREILSLLPATAPWPEGRPFRVVLESDRLEGEIATVLPGLRGG